MRTLILMRHGKAEAASGAGDHGRALTRRGRAEAAEAGRRMSAIVRPSLALVSDSVRTRQTLDCAAPALPPDMVVHAMRTLYGASADAMLAEVRTAPAEAEALLVIGHNPGTGDLAQRLARSGPGAALARLAIGFPTACCAVIALDIARWADAGPEGELLSLLVGDGQAGA